MYLQMVSICLYNDYAKRKSVLVSQTNHVLSHITGATLKDDVIAKFQFQREDLTDKN